MSLRSLAREILANPVSKPFRISSMLLLESTRPASNLFMPVISGLVLSAMLALFSANPNALRSVAPSINLLVSANPKLTMLPISFREFKLFFWLFSACVSTSLTFVET